MLVWFEDRLHLAFFISLKESFTILGNHVDDSGATYGGWDALYTISCNSYYFIVTWKRALFWLLDTITCSDLQLCREKSAPETPLELGNNNGYITVQSLGHVLLFVTPWAAARQASLSFTISWNLLRLLSIESVMPSNRLILCRPLLLPPPIFPGIRVFSNESALLIKWTKYWSFSISPSYEDSGLISFRMDWLDLLVVQGLSVDAQRDSVKTLAHLT